MAESWRDVLPVHPAAELFPQLSRDELLELGEDIKRHGGLPAIPVTLWRAEADPQAFLLDGRNRLDAMEAVGLPVLDKHGEWLTRMERRFIRGGDPYAYVISANIRRRHLTAEQRRDLIAKLIEAEPSKSDRQIAETVKASHHTVGAVRAEMEGRGQVAHVGIRTDTKGRKQPVSKRPHKTKPKTSAPKTKAAIAPPPEQQFADAVAPDEELAVLREFARFFVAERALVSGLDPKDRDEFRSLFGRVKAILAASSVAS
jgi:hypothetical protein